MVTQGKMPPTDRVGENLLQRSGLPTFFEIGNLAEIGLALPENRHGQSVRVWARSLTVMQKEAIVASVGSGAVWRLASDEGPYLDGFDAAPCPLAFLSTGMVASYMNEILALADQRGLTFGDLVLVQDNFYTMEGSALRGTMVGGALPVDLDVRIDTDAEDGPLHDLVAAAVHASPVDGLMRGRLTSLFTLTMNGEEAPVGRVASIGRPAEPDPGDQFPRVRPAAGRAGWEITRLEAVKSIAGVAGGAGSSLHAQQSRKLHLPIRVICRLLHHGSCLTDGVNVEIDTASPAYSPAGLDGRMRGSPSPCRTRRRSVQGVPVAASRMAVSYLAAGGIAFCFIRPQHEQVRQDQLKKAPESLQGHSSGVDPVLTRRRIGRHVRGRSVWLDDVETHVYLDTSAGEDFARRCLDMAEQTVFPCLCRRPPTQAPLWLGGLLSGCQKST